MRILCVFGEHNYGDPSRGVGIEYAAFVPTLRRLGHEVFHFDSWRRSLYRDYADLNRKLLEEVARVQPDILFTVQMNYELWLETLAAIRSHNVLTISWTTDDSWKYREVSRFIGHSYDVITTTYADVVEKYRSDGIPGVFLTQWAANSETLQPPLPAKDCRYPVSFVGMAHGDRKKMAAELRARGIDLQCFGHGWPGGAVSHEQIRTIVRESVISLNFANSKGVNQIKARTFEVPGWGGFLLTEDAPRLESFYTPEKEVAVFSDTRDLAQRIRYYLDHPEERDRIANAAYERTRRDHTYDERIKQLFAFALSQRNAHQSPIAREAESKFEKALRRHSLPTPLRLLRDALATLGVIVWGKRRGPRAARRLIFELSWRLAGAHTFTAAGWPGRMFPEQ